MPKGSDLLVTALANEGVTRIFGVPGEENLDVVESLRGSKIDLVITRHEQAAAFMAATYGRLTGHPGVCISTLGPGALNFSTGAAYGLLGAMPMIVSGDGGFIMNSQEMETAVRLRLNLVVLILQDNAYGMIRWKQAVDSFADWGLTFGNPDFVKYAESYGAKGWRVETADGLVPALETAFKAGGVRLVAVPVDYSENKRVLIDELRDRVG